MNVSRVTKILRCSLVLAVLGVFAACGGGDPDQTGSGDAGQTGETCSGVMLTDAQLCQLKCKLTTQADAESLFGPPQVSISTSSVWRYQCVSVSTGTADLLQIQLMFTGPNATLSTVLRSGVGKFASGKLPACLNACTL